MNQMKIGIFDSGMGGLIVAHAIIERLPQYDYHFLGDTLHVPYGNRSAEAIYELTQVGVSYLFDQGCQLVVVACNTASADAVARLQQEYMPTAYPDRKILGVLIPAAEAAVEASHGVIGVVATTATVASGAFSNEIHKLKPDIAVYEQATPLLVPIIEENETQWSHEIVKAYLSPLLEKQIDTLVLGCTHYPIIKSTFQEVVGEGVTIIAQNEIIPRSVEDYLKRHPEVSEKLSQTSSYVFEVTDITDNNQRLARQLSSDTAELQFVDID